MTRLLILFILSVILSPRACIGADEISVSFVDVSLPEGAKVWGVFLEVTQANEVIIRALPRFWASSTYQTEKRQFNVHVWSATRVNEIAPVIDIGTLNDCVRLSPIVSWRERRRPVVRASVEYVLPLKKGKRGQEILDIVLPSTCIRLTEVERNQPNKPLQGTRGIIPSSATEPETRRP